VYISDLHWDSGKSGDGQVRILQMRRLQRLSCDRIDGEDPQIWIRLKDNMVDGVDAHRLWFKSPRNQSCLLIWTLNLQKSGEFHRLFIVGNNPLLWQLIGIRGSVMIRNCDRLLRSGVPTSPVSVQKMFLS
jgi:hypothetical protein